MINVADRNARRTGGTDRVYRHIDKPKPREDESKTDEPDGLSNASSGPYDVDIAHCVAPFRESSPSLRPQRGLRALTTLCPEGFARVAAGWPPRKRRSS